MLGFNLNHVSKRGPRLNVIGPDYETLAPRGNVSHDINHVYGRPLSTSVGCNINMICSALFPRIHYAKCSCDLMHPGEALFGTTKSIYSYHCSSYIRGCVTILCCYAFYLWHPGVDCDCDVIADVGFAWRDKYPSGLILIQEIASLIRVHYFHFHNCSMFRFIKGQAMGIVTMRRS